jgi:hypothetical protein
LDLVQTRAEAQVRCKSTCSTTVERTLSEGARAMDRRTSGPHVWGQRTACDVERRHIVTGSVSERMARILAARHFQRRAHLAAPVFSFRINHMSIQ